MDAGRLRAVTLTCGAGYEGKDQLEVEHGVKALARTLHLISRIFLKNNSVFLS